MGLRRRAEHLSCTRRKGKAARRVRAAQWPSWRWAECEPSALQKLYLFVCIRSYKYLYLSRTGSVRFIVRRYALRAPRTPDAQAHADRKDQSPTHKPIHTPRTRRIDHSGRGLTVRFSMSIHFASTSHTYTCRLRSFIARASIGGVSHGLGHCARAVPAARTAASPETREGECSGHPTTAQRGRRAPLCQLSHAHREMTLTPPYVRASRNAMSVNRRRRLSMLLQPSAHTCNQRSAHASPSHRAAPRAQDIVHMITLGFRPARTASSSSRTARGGPH